jgi:hypothetical protein
MSVSSEGLNAETLEALLAEIEPLLPEVTYQTIKRWLERLLQLAAVLEQR